MKIHQLLGISFLLLSVSESSLSQGEFYGRGQSTLGASADFASIEQLFGYGESFGFSYKGAFDLNLAFATIFDADGYIISRSTSPSITVYLVKQNLIDNKPTIGLVYSYLFNGKEYWDFAPSGDGGFSVGLMVTRQLLHSERVLIQPSFGITYIHGPRTIAGIASVAIGAHLDSGRILAIVPSISFQSATVAYGVSLEIISDLF